jgi:hypothetical protein
MFRTITKLLAGLAAVAALALGGSAIAGAATSSTTSTTPSTTSTTSRPHAGRPPANFPAPGTAAHEDAEKPVTGDAAAKAQAAAIKSVGGGTAGAVTTDFSGNGFEVTVTKTDGTKVEVHLDSSFNAVQCPGGPGGHGGPGMPPPGGAGNQPPAGQPPTGY